MKTITKIFTALVVLIFVSQANAQYSTNQLLNDILTSVDQIEEAMTQTKPSLRTAVINYYLFKNNNIEVLKETVGQKVAIAQEQADLLENYSDQLDGINNGELNLPYIWNYVHLIQVNLGVYTKIFSDDFIPRLERRTFAGPYRYYNWLLNDVAEIQSSCEAIRTAINNVDRSTYHTFNVKVNLVDANGNPVPVGTLPGYYAQNVATGEYFYGEEGQGQELNIFEELPAGTYVFGAYDGYFDGASSQTVTLSDALVNQNGVITITLSYWSE